MCFPHLEGVTPRALSAYHRYLGPDLPRLKGASVRLVGSFHQELQEDTRFSRRHFRTVRLHPYIITCPSRNTAVDILVALRGLVATFQPNRGITVTAAQYDDDHGINCQLTRPWN